jgi:hypothetical protein
VSRRGWRGGGATAGAVALVAVAAAGGSPVAASAQDGVASLAVGVPVSVLPLQGARPVPSGAWPGGARSLQDLVDAFDAEVDFALSENRGTAQWIGPGAAVRRARRNPLLGVDPERLAYEGLDRSKDKDLKETLYEPLHSQLRSLSALLGTRIVALPLRLVYVPADSAGPAGGAAADSTGPALGHADLRVALIDTRAGQVMWRGWIPGPPSAADAPGLLAELAGRLVGALSP